MILESNTYYDSKSAEDLEQAFFIIKQALGENV